MKRISKGEQLASIYAESVQIIGLFAEEIISRRKREAN